MRSKIKTKANRSSIVRIIISNYDNKSIKEVKIRYNKQAQLDTFLIDSEIKDGSFILKEVKWKAKEKYRYEIYIEKLKDDAFKITKKDKFLSNIGNISNTIREYTIRFKVSINNNTVIVAEIEDTLTTDLLQSSKQQGERVNTRRLKSQTERKLLSKETQLSYSKIACCLPNEIDSIKIYKIKRYLNYRSNMLLFFSLINDFLCEGLPKEKKIKELWEIAKDKENNKAEVEERISQIAKYLQSNLSVELKNYNNRINKAIEKKENLIIDCKNKINNYKKNIKSLDDTKERKKVKNEITNLNNKIEEYKKIIALKKEEELTEIEVDKIKEDVHKILNIYSKLRHNLAHYDYKYFEELFENNSSDSDLTNLLDLNIFKYLTLSKKLRMENKTNYLDDDTKFTILGVRGSAKRYYSLYNTLCEQKNGFNTFINSFFVEDGIENIEFKDKVNEKFEKDIKYFEKYKNNKKNKELELLNEQYDKLSKAAYVWDIHNLKEYKDLYVERKNIIESYNQTLKGNKDKIALKNYGEKLLAIKNEMEEFTKRNSVIRLKYKLQVAYAFIMQEFGGNISRFKDEFDIAKIEAIKKYQSKGEEYLTHINKKQFKIKIFQNQIDEIEKSSEITWLSKNPKNNLFKFYVLTYILLPLEFKGDFLGFVKKHYYDIKNIEYLDENTELSNEQLEKMKNDSFFNKIRLFEKNSKKYTIFSKSILNEERIREYFKKLNIEAKYYEYIDANGETKNIFNKNIIIPIFKYYQIVIKLYNDIEIVMLLHLSKINNISIKEVMDIATSNYYNLRKLFKEYKGNFHNKIQKSYKDLADLRNSIVHFDYEKFIGKLLEVDYTNGSGFNVNGEIRKLIKFIEPNISEIKKLGLGFDFINDYYMRKEQFIFGQLKQTDKTITNSNQEKESIENKELLKICKLRLNENSIESINGIYEKHEILKNISKELNSENFDQIINGSEIDLERLKKELGKKHKDKKYKLNMDNIKKGIEQCSSDILGLYKQKVIRVLKKKIIEKIQYNEEKILHITTYEIGSKRKDIYSVFIEREGLSDNFYFYSGDGNNYQVKEESKELNIGAKIKLILKICTEEKSRNKCCLYLFLNKDTEEKRAIKREVVDLRKYYSFSGEVKFKDLK